MTRSLDEYERVRALIDTGLSDHHIALRSGIPRSTVRDWRARESPPAQPLKASDLHDWRPPKPGQYSYLLGLFLGDGCLIRRNGASPQLVLTLDRRYPGIIEAAASAIQVTACSAAVPRALRPGCIALLSSDPIWAPAFPQGLEPGRKHLRSIALMPWQRGLTGDFPWPFLRGLIDSDGCRSINRFSTELPSGRRAEYRYARYFFTNYSADIRRIFCDHCDQVGIRWTQSSFKNISIADRGSVALMDRFIGPKR